MQILTQIPNINDADYWQQMDKLFAEVEKKNMIAAIKKSDTEKFYDFTAMMRITNTLKKVKILKQN